MAAKKKAAKKTAKRKTAKKKFAKKKKRPVPGYGTSRLGKK